MVKFRALLASMSALVSVGMSSACLAQTAVLSPSVAPQRTSISFTPPAGWMAMQSSLGRISVLPDRKFMHVVWTQVTAKRSDLEAYAAEEMDSARKKGADVSDDGVTSACDGTMPAHRWTIHSLSNATPTVGHFLATTVSGGIGTAGYSHAQAIGDRQDAIAALGTLCPGPHDLVAPNGWAVPQRGLAMYNVLLNSPDSTSTFVGLNRKIGHDKFPAFEKSNLLPGSVIADRTEPCGTGSLHHVDVRNGNQLSEVAIGYTEGFAYRFIYTRPADHDADTSAESALKAFCRSSMTAPLTSASI